MNVTGVYFNDAMLRQISEGIKINKVDEDSLINSKNEWNYFQFPRAVVMHGRVIPPPTIFFCFKNYVLVDVNQMYP